MSQFVGGAVGPPAPALRVTRCAGSSVISVQLGSVLSFTRSPAAAADSLPSERSRLERPHRPKIPDQRPVFPDDRSMDTVRPYIDGAQDAGNERDAGMSPNSADAIPSESTRPALQLKAPPKQSEGREVDTHPRLALRGRSYLSQCCLPHQVCRSGGTFHTERVQVSKSWLKSKRCLSSRDSGDAGQACRAWTS